MIKIQIKDLGNGTLITNLNAPNSTPKTYSLNSSLAFISDKDTANLDDVSQELYTVIDNDGGRLFNPVLLPEIEFIDVNNVSTVATDSAQAIDIVENFSGFKKGGGNGSGLQSVELNGTDLIITTENGENYTADLSPIITTNIDVDSFNWNASSNVISLTETDGETFTIDLSEFVISSNTLTNGDIEVKQEGEVKFTIPLSNYYTKLEVDELLDSQTVVITQNTTLSNIHNGKTLEIKANVILTFPTGLNAIEVGVILRDGYTLTRATATGVALEGDVSQAQVTGGGSAFIQKFKDEDIYYWRVSNL